MDIVLSECEQAKKDYLDLLAATQDVQDQQAVSARTPVEEFCSADEDTDLWFLKMNNLYTGEVKPLAPSPSVSPSSD